MRVLRGRVDGNRGLHATMNVYDTAIARTRSTDIGAAARRSTSRLTLFIARSQPVAVFGLFAPELIALN